MTPGRIFRWLGRNAGLALTLAAAAILGSAIGQAVRSAAGLFLPVTLAGVLAGWGVARTRLNGWQAAGALIAAGALGVFLAVAGLAGPLAALILSLFDLLAQLTFWLRENMTPDPTALLALWQDILNRAAALLARLGTWGAALIAGRPQTDPAAAGLAWGVGLWLVCAWSGWTMRRHNRGLAALAPGGVVLAATIDYAVRESGLVVGYLAAMLALAGLGHWQRLHARLAHRRMDYAESVPQETLLMAAAIGVLLVSLAGISPSLSWRDLRDWLQPERTTSRAENLAESMGLQPAQGGGGGSGAENPFGLPRNQLVGMPPELGRALVMTIATGEFPPISGPSIPFDAPRYYWRTTTYDVYTGFGWTSSPATTSALPANTALMAGSAGYRPMRLNVTLANRESMRVYWTGALASADVRLDIAWRIPPPEPSAATPANNGDMLGALTSQNSYTVTAFLPQAAIRDLRAAGEAYPPEIAERYLRLPDSLPNRVLGLARDLTATAATPYDRVRQIEAYLRLFPYSLEVQPPPPGRDIVDHFLFDLQTGYCDYYASAMVVLSRAAGVPARLVVGYASGEYDTARAVYMVRQQDAHAWAEVYFPGTGWVEFEPTAALPAINRPSGSAASQAEETGTQSVVAALVTATRVQLRMLTATLGGQLMLGALGLATLVWLWFTAEIWWLAALARLNPPRAARLLYNRLKKRTRRLLPGLEIGLTPGEMQCKLSERFKKSKTRLPAGWMAHALDEVDAVVTVYVAQTFSNHPPDSLAVKRAVAAWARLRWRLRVIGWLR